MEKEITDSSGSTLEIDAVSVNQNSEDSSGSIDVELVVSGKDFSHEDREAAQEKISVVDNFHVDDAFSPDFSTESNNMQSPESSSQLIDTDVPVISPFLYLTHVLRDERNRSKLCLAVGGCMNEIGLIEDVYGKKILKIGSKCDTRREQWPVMPNSVWGQIGVTMERLGKQHIGFHLCVSQSIVRGLLTLGDSICKQVDEYEEEIKLDIRTLSKQSVKYNKSYRKYEKLIRDAEVSIKAREDAIIQYEAKVNRTEKEANAQDVTSYLNRGLNKMFSKIIPTEGYRTIHDRCRSLLSEIDDAEVSLAIQADQLNMLHAQLEEKCRLLAEKVAQLEEQRLDNTKDGLLRFCQASEGMLEHNKNILENLRGFTVAAASDGANSAENSRASGCDGADSPNGGDKERLQDMVFLETELAALESISRDKLANHYGISSSTQSFSEDELSDDRGRKQLNDGDVSSSDSELNIDILMHSFEKLKGALSTLANINFQTTVFFSGVADAEQRFCDLAVKLFENCGYNYSNNSGGVSMSVVLDSDVSLATGSGSCDIAQDSARELISCFESPMTRLGWDSLIRAVEHFTEAHSMSAELLLQQCSVSTDEAQRKIEACCQENVQRVQEVSVNLDNIKSQQSRLRSKLSRVRKEIADRKESSGVTSATAGDRNDLRKQVLQEEEDVVSNQLCEVTNSAHVIVRESVSVLEGAVSVCKNEIEGQLAAIILSYQEFLDSNNIKFNIWQRAIRKVRDDVESIDIDQDMKFYRERIQHMYDHHVAALHNTDEDLGLPKRQEFFPIHCDVVDLERSNERESLLQQDDMLRPSSPTFELSSAASGSGSASSSGGGKKKVLGSIIGGIKAIGDIGMNGGTQILEGVSRGRRTGKRDDPRARSRSAGSGTCRGQKDRDRDLGALNREFEVRQGRRKSEVLCDKAGRQGSDRSRSQSVCVSEFLGDELDGVDIDAAPTVKEKHECADDFDEEDGDEDDDKHPTILVDLDEEDSSESPKGKMELKDFPFQFPEPLKEPPVRVNPELVKFGIADEKIIEHFSCALIPKRGLLTHGRMFITQRHIAFSGWPELRVLIPLQDVEHLKKTNTVYIIPNAITVHAVSGENYFFGSLIDRDSCFELLSSMVNIAKSLVQVMGDDASTSSAPPILDVSNPVEQENTAATGNMRDDLSGNLKTSSDVTDSKGTPHTVSLDCIVDYELLFDEASITKLHDCQLEASSSHVWQVGWQSSAGYRQFLESEGDLEIQLSEWEVFNEVVVKDSSKLKFHFCRTCTYLHPRTSMLMFGPKNAPAQQVQYLHIPEWLDMESSFVSVANLEKLHPVSNAIVMTATQFDGIPMADVFKVYMYWSFEALCSAEEKAKGGNAGEVAASLCRVRMGLRVDYLKYSLIKSQIFAGTKEELVVLSKQWEQFFRRRVEARGIIRKPIVAKKKKSRKNLLLRVPHTVSLDCIVDYELLFDEASITKLHDCQLEASSSHVWQVGWQSSAGYRQFLESEGDLEIQLSEWEVFNEVVVKDSSKLKFHFCRTCTYLHPRTSMLMFGPKNAPAQQVQYLHIPEWLDMESSFVSVANLEKLHPVSNAIVMTATQFDGIPMADVFKVYMYWSFEALCSAEEKAEGGNAGEVAASLCRVRMGLRVDFLKSTMLKSQIFAGTKEELVVLSKQWEQHLSLKISTDRRIVAGSDDDLSCDEIYDGESDVGMSITEHMKLALREHDKLKLGLLNSSSGNNADVLSFKWLGLVAVAFLLQVILLLVMYRKIAHLEDIVERQFGSMRDGCPRGEKL